MRHKLKPYRIIIRRFKKARRLLKKRTKKIVIGLLATGIVLAFMTVIASEDRSIHTAGLLDTIARVESKGNYDAYFGNADNQSIKFTSMTVGEVLAWQQEFVNSGNPSSAVGRYQFIDSTLRGLMVELNIDENQTFSPTLQDRLAVALLERRGLHDYVDGKISRQQFAHNLSKEWAALPKVVGDSPEQSYYASDGLNKAQLSIKDIYSGIATVRKL